jgi:hypothetical protein
MEHNKRTPGTWSRRWVVGKVYIQDGSLGSKGRYEIEMADVIGQDYPAELTTLVGAFLNGISL